MDADMIIRSGYLIDCTGRVLRNPQLHIVDGHIAELDTFTSPSAVSQEYVDLGDCSILIPGLVNAHAHLELTLARPGVHPRNFTEWLHGIIGATRGWDRAYYSQSLREGIRMAIQAGTVAVGDIVGHADTAVYPAFPVRGRVFLEVIDFNPATAAATADRLKCQLDELPRQERVAFGISPHTPYTVSERLLQECATLARVRELPLCIHLCETAAEAQFLEEGTGEILEFRNRLGLPPQWTPPGKSPVRYLRDLGLLERPAVLVHCNYATEDDMDMIAAAGASVVFCPRSHAYFGHQRHPVVRMLEKGITVALGTDSLASNYSLSVLEEMKVIRALYAEVSALDILKMGTIHGLRTLSLPQKAAQLQPGCPADLTAVAVSDEEMRRCESPLEALFAGSARVTFSMVQGCVTCEGSHGLSAVRRAGNFSSFGQ